MKRLMRLHRYYGSSAKTVDEIPEEKLDFMHLRHESKVPVQPVKVKLIAQEEIEISKRTVQLLERLALVNLDGEEALRTLKSGIKFAERIESINTEGTEALYTVLEYQPLYLREDQVNEGGCKEQILQNAKIIEEDYFISPPGNIPLTQ